MAQQMTDEQVTVQLEALNTVHLKFADNDKKSLKRKLAQCEKELADTKKLLLEEQNGRTCERYDIISFCEDGSKQLNKIRSKLSKGIRTGMHLSKEDVSQLTTFIIKADQRFDNTKYTIGGDESNNSFNDDEDDEEEGQQ